jgi:hypothetical protein
VRSDQGCGGTLRLGAVCGAPGVVTSSSYLNGASPYFNARGCSDSTPLNVPTGNRQPGCRCRCSMWARAPLLDSLSACTGPWQYLQRMISARSVSASKIVHGSQRPRTFTSHSVITGGFFFVATDVFGCLQTSCRHRFLSTLKPELELSARQSGEGYVGKVMISRPGSSDSIPASMPGYQNPTAFSRTN